MSRTAYRTCHLCEAMCGLELELEGDAVRSIRGDAQDPLSRGHICPKAVALQDLHADPDRLREPLRRTPAGWEPIGWDAAFDLVAERLRAVQEEHGRDAVAVYQGNPSVHNLGTMLFSPPFVRALGTRSRFSATSVDQLPHHVAAYHLFGHQFLLPIPDLERTHFFLLLGGNPAASNGSMMTVPDVAKRLGELRARGGRAVLVDPRRTETARHCDEHHFVRPGSDAFLLAALVHTLFAEERLRLGRLDPHLQGVEAVRAALEPFSPEAVAEPVGMDAETIRELARAFADAPSAVCHGRMGLSTQRFGGLCQWLTQVLNIVSGNFDRPGGALFTTPAVSVVDRLHPGRTGRWRSRVRGLPEFAGELPVSVLCEEMRTPGPGRIRGLVTSAGNPVLSTPAGAELDAALAELEFMVSIDIYLNETTRHAHVILPPVGPLERDHYDLVFNALAIRNVARFSPALFPKPPNARHDWEIFAELEARLAPRGLRAGLERRARRRLGPRGILALGLRAGPYGRGWKPFGAGLTLGALERAPHGVDLGPLQPQLPERLFHADKQVHLAPQLFLDDLPRLEAALAEPLPEGLLLIGRRDLRSNNSWMHNCQRLMRGKDRCTLLVHPEDAARLGLSDGAPARVVSRVGELEVPVAVSDTMMPGVVCLPHGWGHGRPGVRLRVAAERPGVSMNDLTDPAQVDAITGNAVLNGVPVRVLPLEAAAG